MCEIVKSCMKSFIELFHSKCDIEYELKDIVYVLESITSDCSMDPATGVTLAQHITSLILGLVMGI